MKGFLAGVGAAILRFFHVEKWRVAAIANEVGVHHSAVTRVLRAARVPPTYTKRPSRVEPFLPFVQDLLDRFPKITASRIFVMVRERGYVGCASHFRDVVSRMRRRPAPEAFLRIRTLPGEEARASAGDRRCGADRFPPAPTEP